jgi:beta-glucanase (GH16 family)
VKSLRSHAARGWAGFSPLSVLPLLALVSCSSPPPEIGSDYWAGPQGTWQPVLTEDFDGPAGSAPNAANWNVMVNGSPYNDEKEYYTNRPSNVMLDGSGHLVLTAQKESFVDASGVPSAQPYTSGRIETKDKVMPLYGRIEARIQMPAGKGLWPAFWMLGQNIDTVQWPQCGELDILELRGSNPTSITGSLHAPGYSGTKALHGDYTKTTGSFADGFHVFAVEWQADGIRWLVDDVPFAWRTPQGLQNIFQKWDFDHPMYIILNLAVGGIYDGDPTAATPMPSQMLVDYVKVSRLVP